jgi:mono/diheme cytochrome c family protein
MSASRVRNLVRRAAGLAPGLLLLAAASAGGIGCQQKMAEQPYYRPYEPSDFFPDGRSSRPLEAGVVHRGQHLDSDPLVTGLTQEEWGRFWRRDAAKVNAEGATPDEDREHAYGAPRFDQRPGQPHAGPAVYVTEFPFEITAADLSRGADRYTAFCAICHGPLGNGKGKIWERGYLKPTSYHTEKVEPTEPDDFGQIPLGYSRGYWKWDIRVPVREVPVGYIFEVITKGYGGMPDHAAQIKPEDRWRIIAYVRTLQLSQHAEFGKLPPDVQQKVTTEKAPAGGNHP